MSESPPLDDASPEIGESPERSRNRCVSGMTVAQRERKRANDRRSQRASRARTRQHIQRLERELETLRNIRPEEGADENAVIQELIRRNQELEIELIRLRSTSESPLSPTSNFAGIPGAGRALAYDLEDGPQPEPPSTYLPESIPPVDNRSHMGFLLPPPSSSVANHFDEASSMGPKTVSYALSDAYARADLLIPSNSSGFTTLNGAFVEGSGAGMRNDGRDPGTPQISGHSFLGEYGSSYQTINTAAKRNYY
ncbi:hypothetical protein NOR_07668 [Metarhizium rileyi]|uniref:BZIP domain-containing protein n=1 Tax=Metarhizium rileyi (strain RCEF 4871) TaxID=1649241 RepID=A0A166XQ74_METRR|nr:hypothetical protein NOR_07668 [Metarhizium rileyi RCEF 4871]TWU72961.1 hypothetical protein ED733_003530 [Metarhizium rileyi]